MTSFPLTFSIDGKLLFCCCANLVKIISVATTQFVGVLKGHTAKVVGVKINPRNRLQVYTASRDKTIKVWDFSDGTCLDTFDLGISIEQFVIHGDHAIVNADPKPHKSFEDQPRSCQIKLYNFSDRSLVRLYKSKACHGFAIKDDLIASIANNTLSVYRKSTKKLIRLTHSHSLTTVAFHPSDPYLATGDDEGRITLWHGYETDDVVTSSLHWHAHSVTSLAFSGDGTYLLSGGEEAVLVFWQLESGHKQFLPRLGSTLKNITLSPNGNLIAVGGGDNSIRLINSVSSRVQKVIQGLGHAHRHKIRKGERSLRTGLVRHPSQPWIVLQGMPGNVQIFDPFSDSHVKDINVTSRNHISRAHKTLPSTNRVEHIAFGKGAKWMATVDRWIEAGKSDRVCLKVWALTPQKQYVMHTRIDQPHTSKVTSLAFHPSKPLFVTASTDFTFKLWSPTRRSASQRTLLESPAWAVKAEGTYRHGYEITDASFSADGSILAVACGQVVTLWDPYTMALRRTLCHPPPRHPIRRLHFLKGTSFLVVTTSQAVYVWHLLTLQVHWSFQMPVASISTFTTSQGDALFAVAVDWNRGEKKKKKKESKARKPKNAEAKASEDARPPSILLFGTKEPVPIKEWDVPDMKLEVCKDSGISTASLTIMENEHGESSVIYLGHQKQLLHLSVKDETKNTTTTADHKAASIASIIKETRAVSAFEELYGAERHIKDMSDAPPPASTLDNTLARHIDNPSVFDAPTHILPPVHMLFTSYMDLIAPRLAEVASTADAMDTEEEDQDGDENENEDTDMESKEESGVRVVSPQPVALPTRLFEWDDSYMSIFSSSSPSLSASTAPPHAHTKSETKTPKKTNKKTNARTRKSAKKTASSKKKSKKRRASTRRSVV